MPAHCAHVSYARAPKERSCARTGWVPRFAPTLNILEGTTSVLLHPIKSPAIGQGRHSPLPHASFCDDMRAYQPRPLSHTLTHTNHPVVGTAAVTNTDTGAGPTMASTPAPAARPAASTNEADLSGSFVDLSAVVDTPSGGKMRARPSIVYTENAR